MANERIPSIQLWESSIKDCLTFATKTRKLYILFTSWCVYIELLGSLNVMDEQLIYLGQSEQPYWFVHDPIKSTVWKKELHGDNRCSLSDEKDV